MHYLDKDIAKVALLIAETGEHARRDQDSQDLTWKNLSIDEKRQQWHVSPMKSLPPNAERFVQLLFQVRDGKFKAPSSIFLDLHHLINRP